MTYFLVSDILLHITSPVESAELVLCRLPKSGIRGFTNDSKRPDQAVQHLPAWWIWSPT